MTELIWQGKYDENGKRTAPLRVSLPFQTVETINESTMERQRMLDLFSAGRDSDWRNRLIWGDKKYVMPSLLDEFAGKVNLIYIDPPFNVGADFSFTATLADHDETDEDETTEFIKQPSVIEQKAYRDTWGGGLVNIFILIGVALVSSVIGAFISSFLGSDWRPVWQPKRDTELWCQVKKLHELYLDLQQMLQRKLSNQQIEELLHRVEILEKYKAEKSIYGDSSTYAPPRVALRETDNLLCPNCNSPYSSEAIFCMMCGTQLVIDSSPELSPSSGKSNFLYCHQCGSPNPSGAKYCKSCGTLLPGDSTTEAPPPDVGKKKKGE